MLKIFAFLSFFYTLLLAILLAAGVGVGWVLHFSLGFDFAISSLIGTVAVIGSLRFTFGLVKTIADVEEKEALADAADLEPNQPGIVRVVEVMTSRRLKKPSRKRRDES